MDAYLISLFEENIVTIYFSIVVLKAISEVTPWTWDSKLIDAIDHAISIVHPTRGTNGNVSK
jgi:hypothetical protein